MLITVCYLVIMLASYMSYKAGRVSFYQGHEGPMILLFFFLILQTTFFFIGVSQ